MQAISIGANGFVFDGFCAGDRGGEAVMLLHGFPQTAYVWRHQLAALAEAGYYAVALNQRGIANRARPTFVDGYRLPLLVSDVVAMADALEFDAMHLIGHDWGGSLAWVTAALHANRINTLTVLSTPHPYAFLAAFADELGDQRERARYMLDLQKPAAADTLLADSAAGLRNLYVGSGMDAADVDFYVAQLNDRARLDAALNWYRAVNYKDLGDADLRIRNRTLYISGTEDAAFADDAIRKTADYCLGGFTQHAFINGNHWLPESMAADVNRVLLRFLASQ
jgi:pimeloyl-ACP methyl ester carboxylesterase